MQNYVHHNNFISRDFAREMTDEFDWYHYSLNNVQEDWLYEFKDRLDWKTLLIFSHLPMNFIKRFKEEVRFGFTFMMMNRTYSPDEQYEIQQLIK